MSFCKILEISPISPEILNIFGFGIVSMVLSEEFSKDKSFFNFFSQTDARIFFQLLKDERILIFLWKNPRSLKIP